MKFAQKKDALILRNFQERDEWARADAAGPIRLKCETAAQQSIEHH